MAIVDDFVTDRTAAVCIGSCFSEVWDVETGVGQGAVLSGFLFNLLINGLAAAVKRACRGVACGPGPDAPRVQILLYADDIVILCDNPADLQRALDAAHAWADAWRFHVSVGPTKSAVMLFGCRSRRDDAQQFHVGEQILPWVSTYTYLGVTLHQRLSWAHHVDALLRRGERKMAACVSWTSAANLPLCFVERIFQNYVCPSACFGLEFVPAGPQLRRFQTRFLQWGRRLLAWPRGSPGVVVQGQLGWHDVVTVHLTQAAGLCARLLSLPPHCCAVRIAQYACTKSQSWIQSVLHNHGVPHPHAHHPPFVAGCVM